MQVNIGQKKQEKDGHSLMNVVVIQRVQMISYVLVIEKTEMTGQSQRGDIQKN